MATWACSRGGRGRCGWRGFAGVVGVLFEGEAEDGDALAGDGVEEGADDFFDEAGFLPVVEWTTWRQYSATSGRPKDSQR
jgi:hypothetical protein